MQRETEEKIAEGEEICYISIEREINVTIFKIKLFRKEQDLANIKV